MAEERFRLNARGRTHVEKPVQKQVVPPNVIRARREPRSGDILRAVVDIDVATDPATQKQLTDWLSETYDLRGGGQLIGLFAKCHLGHPYVDHRLALAGAILEHYTPTDQVPAPYSAGRPFARNNAYLFIEIYSDGTVIPVRANGEPAI